MSKSKDQADKEIHLCQSILDKILNGESIPIFFEEEYNLITKSPQTIFNYNLDKALKLKTELSIQALIENLCKINYFKEKFIIEKLIYPENGNIEKPIYPENGNMDKFIKNFINSVAASIDTLQKKPDEILGTNDNQEQKDSPCYKILNKILSRNPAIKFSKNERDLIENYPDTIYNYYDEEFEKGKASLPLKFLILQKNIEEFGYYATKIIPPKPKEDSFYDYSKSKEDSFYDYSKSKEETFYDLLYEFIYNFTEHYRKKVEDFINVRDENGNTALILACKNNDSDFITTFLKFKGVENIINVQDENGNTALILACKNNNSYAITNLLKVKGIDVTIINDERKNALSYIADHVNAFPKERDKVLQDIIAQIASKSLGIEGDDALPRPSTATKVGSFNKGIGDKGIDNRDTKTMVENLAVIGRLIGNVPNSMSNSILG